MFDVRCLKREENPKKWKKIKKEKEKEEEIEKHKIKSWSVFLFHLFPFPSCLFSLSIGLLSQIFPAVTRTRSTGEMVKTTDRWLDLFLVLPPFHLLIGLGHRD